jgi:galacturan 1,4-alpha-galacturonidase
MRLEAESTNASSHRANTDGFDTLNVAALHVTNTFVNVGDDCFSLKPSTTDTLVRNLTCNGTHGVSMGVSANTRASSTSSRTCGSRT